MMYSGNWQADQVEKKREQWIECPDCFGLGCSKCHLEGVIDICNLCDLGAEADRICDEIRDKKGEKG